MKIVALVAALALAATAASVPAQQHRHGGHGDHSFANAERWAKMFDDPARDAWQKPDEVVAALKLAPDAVVADIGAGTGYFAVRLAKAVPQGRVFAVDAERDMVRYLGERARKENLSNVVPVQASGKGVTLPAPVDVALLVDVYHHIDARPAYFGALKASLKPGGRVAIVDFRPETKRGPMHKLPVTVVKDEMAKAGYRVVAEHGFLPDQYFVVFAPQ
jgi:cyclopropane fatty-acyl-phospholipid synthase-like methyltransferase